MSSYDQDYGQPPSARDASRALRASQQVAPQAPLVIPEIEALRAYPPGGPWRELAAEIGIPEEEILLLAANENVLGPSQKAVEAGKRALSEVHLYPDGGANLLRRKLAETLDVSVDSVVVGNGSNDIIELLVRTFVGPGEFVVSAWPSFVVYRLVTQAHGRDILVAPLARDRYDLSAMAALVDPMTKLVFIANPNNPTGTYVTSRELDLFLDRIPPSTIVVLDEAYIEYVTASDFPNGLDYFRRRPRTVVLRTFSKIYGLAGLRVGYGILEPELATYLNRVRQPYNSGAVAQAAALAALSDQEHVSRSRKMVREGMAQLEAGLAKLSLSCVPSQANFLVIKLSRPGNPIQDQLRRRGILVRAMSGYGMDDCIRITVGTSEMNQRFLSALEQILSSEG